MAAVVVAERKLKSDCVELDLNSFLASCVFLGEMIAYSDRTALPD